MANKYFLRELVESISLEESLEEIAYRASARLVVTPDFPPISPGQEIRISGIPFNGTDMVYLLHPGVVWECNSSTQGQKHLTATVYDKTIYLAKTEDEYIFPTGQTATQRLRHYASDWGIKLGQLSDSKIALAKSIYRAQPIYSMIQADLKETVKKGGDMYRVRMTPNGLDLVKLGSNKTVWVLEDERNLQEISQHRTLEGVATQVKVLGKESEGKRTPILTTVTGEISKYGTLQRVLQDEKVKTVAQAKSAGQKMLSGVQETISVKCLDINTIRAGDKVKLNGMELLVTSVQHELGASGSMQLELASSDYVRRRYYVE